MKKNNIFLGIIFIELLVIIVLIFNLSVKLKNQTEIINKQSEKIKECDYEIKRLKLVEQDYETDKEYIYECFKQIEINAEGSGK